MSFKFRVTILVALIFASRNPCVSVTCPASFAFFSIFYKEFSKLLDGYKYVQFTRRTNLRLCMHSSDALLGVTCCALVTKVKISVSYPANFAFSSFLNKEFSRLIDDINLQGIHPFF